MGVDVSGLGVEGRGRGFVFEDVFWWGGRCEQWGALVLVSISWIRTATVVAVCVFEKADAVAPSKLCS